MRGLTLARSSPSARRLFPTSRQPQCQKPPAPFRCDVRCESASVNGNGSSAADHPVSGAQMMAETGATASGTSLMSKSLGTLTVRDMMTSPSYSLPPETEVTKAMEFLVEKGISGVPVIDAHGSVLGVCSGYDLLALDSTPGKLDKSYFPPIDTCINEFGGDRKMMWSNFKQLRKKLQAANGSTVEEVMHKAFKIEPSATMEDAANMIVQKQAHRICVIEGGKLIGIVSRGDVMRATIANFNAYMSRQDAKEEAT